MTQKIEVDGTEQEFVSTSQAYFYAMWKELEAITGEKIDEDAVTGFLDEKLTELSECLESNWNDWNDEQADDEDEE